MVSYQREPFLLKSKLALFINWELNDIHQLLPLNLRFLIYTPINQGKERLSKDFHEIVLMIRASVC